MHLWPDVPTNFEVTVTDATIVRDRLNQLFDFPILGHRFAPYMRDYLVLAEIGAPAERRGQYLYTFTHCPMANVTTAVRDDVWRRSWDDRFINHTRWVDEGQPDGFVWGVNWSMAYPGPTYIEDSALAREWGERFGRDMHEAIIETESFRLQLVFHDIRIKRTGDDVSIYDSVVIPLA